MRILPGITGVGAPWWRPDARGTIAGLTAGTKRAQVARAALEGIAWRVADIVGAVRESVAVETLRVDGGLTNEPTLLQLQADAIGVPVEQGLADATAAGAAALAAVGAGLLGSVADDRRPRPDHRAASSRSATTPGARTSTRRGGGSSSWRSTSEDGYVPQPCNSTSSRRR